MKNPIVDNVYDEMLEGMDALRDKLCVAIQSKLVNTPGPVALNTQVPTTSVGVTLLVTEINFNDATSELVVMLSDNTISGASMLSTDTLLGIYGSLVIDPQ